MNRTVAILLVLFSSWVRCEAKRNSGDGRKAKDGMSREHKELIADIDAAPATLAEVTAVGSAVHTLMSSLEFSFESSGMQRLCNIAKQSASSTLAGKAPNTSTMIPLGLVAGLIVVGILASFVVRRSVPIHERDDTPHVSPYGSQDPSKHSSRQYAEAAFNELDTNNNGQVNEDEFVAGMENRGVSEDLAKDMFKRADEDGDGYLELDPSSQDAEDQKPQDVPPLPPPSLEEDKSGSESPGQEFNDLQVEAEKMQLYLTKKAEQALAEQKRNAEDEQSQDEHLKKRSS